MPTARASLPATGRNVPRWADIEGVDPSKFPPANVVVGGFPCQDLSVAGVGGARTGLQGARSGLWSRMAGVVEAQRPAWVVVENVARGVDRWLPVVRTDLERLGYATIPVPLEARHVGAPHIRPRIFVLAHADRFALRVEQQRVSGRREGGLPEEGEPLSVEPGEGRGWGAQPPLSVVADGFSRGVAGAYYRAVGNAVIPQVAEVVGWMIRELVDAGARSH